MSSQIQSISPGREIPRSPSQVREGRQVDELRGEPKERAGCEGMWNSASLAGKVFMALLAVGALTAAVFCAFLVVSHVVIPVVYIALTAGFFH